MEWFAVWNYLDNKWKFEGWVWTSRDLARSLVGWLPHGMSLTDTKGNKVASSLDDLVNLFQSQRGYDGFGSTYAPVISRRAFGRFCQ